MAAQIAVLDRAVCVGVDVDARPLMIVDGAAAQGGIARFTDVDTGVIIITKAVIQDVAFCQTSRPFVCYPPCGSGAGWGENRLEELPQFQDLRSARLKTARVA
jgi:hypothetical protein